MLNTVRALPVAVAVAALSVGTQGTFDSFHPFIPKGNAASSGSIETLLTSSADEPFTEYGLIAESVEYPQDRSWVVFNLRREARWHDGRPITADDVVWSFETLTSKGAPQYRFYYASVEQALKLGERRVKFTFSEQGNRELPLIVGQLPILPQHYWEDRDFEKTTLEPPLGSGPYRITDFEPGRYTLEERVEDYWGRDRPSTSACTTSTASASSTTATTRPSGSRSRRAISTSARRTRPRPGRSTTTCPRCARAGSRRSWCATRCPPACRLSS